MGRFEFDELDKINHVLGQVGDIQPGVYKIDPESSAWKDYPFYDVSKEQIVKGKSDEIGA